MQRPKDTGKNYPRVPSRLNTISAGQANVSIPSGIAPNDLTVMCLEFGVVQAKGHR